MSTQVFENYFSFSKREDRKANGVSAEFAALNPEYEKQNETNEGCWNCSRCSRCSGCSGCSDCSDCSDCSGCSGCSRCSDCSRCSGCSGCSRCSDCSGCSGCSGCSRCSDCSGCSGCSDCSRCSDCSDCSRCSRCSRCSDCSRCSRCSDCSDLENASPVQGEKKEYPKIENIHTKILEAVSVPNALNMSTWHACETTHCRAGWAVHLAGEEGKKLEDKTSTLFAAMMIYGASSEIRVSPTRFFESNEVAMQDMQRCAELEKEIKI